MQDLIDIVVTVAKIVFSMSLVGIVYYLVLVGYGLSSNIITMLTGAVSIFLLYALLLGSPAESYSRFNFICWEPGIFIIAPVAAAVTVLFICIVKD